MNFKEILEEAIKECDHRYGVPFLLYELEIDFTEIENEIIDTSRWEVHHRAVYEHEGRFWAVSYAAPATENQEWDSYDVQIYEVEPQERTITVYRALR